MTAAEEPTPAIHRGVPLPGHICACGAEPVRTLGTRSYCWACAEHVLAPLRDRHMTDEGIVGSGFRRGPVRTDWGEDWAELGCTVCDASWVGPIGEVCPYCERTRHLLNEATRAVLLHPELPDCDDRRHEQMVADWARRLGWAVKAGLITEHEARRVLGNRETRHVA